jgi:hypothetical protein
MSPRVGRGTGANQSSSLGPFARYLDSARNLLSRAVFFIDARESGTGQTARNLGFGGSALDAQYGSSASADTNDPLLLEHTGTNYLYTPDSANNFASTPDAAALDITGAVDLRGRFRRTTGTSDGYLLIKGSTYATLSYGVLITSAGNLAIYTKDFAGNARDYTSTATVPYNATDAFWWRVACDPVAATVTFYTAADQATPPTSWTPLGAVVPGTWTGSALQANNETLVVNFLVDGEVYYAQVLDGIGGTVVFDANFTTGITSGGQTSFTESSSNAATVTISRSTSGRKSVAVVRNVWLLGTNDNFEVADNNLIDFGASDSFTILAFVRYWGAIANNALIGKGTGDVGASMQGYQMFFSAGVPSFRLGDGTTRVGGVTTSTSATGQLALYTMHRDTVLDQVWAERFGAESVLRTTDTSTGTLATSEKLIIGGTSVTGYSECELLAAAIFRRSLADDEMTALSDYFMMTV